MCQREGEPFDEQRFMPDKKRREARPGDPIEVNEPKNVRPPSEPTPRRAPPLTETDEEA